MKKQKPKFKEGDSVIIVNPDSWACGCAGMILSVFPMEKAAPYYTVKVKNSPNPYISVTYVREVDIEKGATHV